MESQFQPATVFNIRPRQEKEEAVGAFYDAPITASDFPDRQQLQQLILQLPPGYRLADAFRQLSPTASGCTRRIVGPVHAQIEEVCPQVFQVPDVETVQQVVHQPEQRIEYVPEQRTYIRQVWRLHQEPFQQTVNRPVLRQYLRPVTVTQQRQVLRNVIQNVPRTQIQQIL